MNAENSATFVFLKFSKEHKSLWGIDTVVFYLKFVLLELTNMEYGYVSR